MKNYHESDDNGGRFFLRLLVAAVAVLLGLFVLLHQLYVLQVKNFDYYHTLAEDNRISLLPIVPQRGNIIDRNGATLARNFVAYTLEISSRISDADVKETIDALSKFIAIDNKDRNRFQKFRKENKRLDSAPIRTRLSDEEVARFIGQRYRFPGVDVQARLFRDYPNGKLASHLVGYISRINDAEVEYLETTGDAANYRGTEHIGKLGVEATYEADLHGVTGVEHVEVNAGGRAVRRLKSESATAGSDIELSVDIELQKVAEAAFGERRGALVAIDPTNGEVLALVSMPTFDPNLFVDGISSADWSMLQEVGIPRELRNKPLLNRAIYSAYPPGSTFKPFMAMAGLTYGKRKWTQKISDPGYYWFGGHQFMDDKKGGHGAVDMYKSLVVSCNTYYYMLAADLQIERIAAFMPQFGLGSLTGIDLPGEATGVLPSPEWKRKRYKTKEQQKWYAGETISVGIGQGYNAYTPIQMAQAMATIANNGKRMRPHVLRAVVDSQGKRQEFPPELVTEVDVDPEYLANVRMALEDVTRFGTGARAFAGAPYRAGAKTGTAQVYSLKGGKYDKSNERMRDHSWFIAYAPAEAPRIALAVMVENGGFGAVSAAPIARQVIDAYLLEKHAEAPAPEDAGADDDTAEGVTVVEHGEEEEQRATPAPPPIGSPDSPVPARPATVAPAPAKPAPAKPAPEPAPTPAPAPAPVAAPSSPPPPPPAPEPAPSRPAPPPVSAPPPTPPAQPTPPVQPEVTPPAPPAAPAAADEGIAP
jgi:penicillin-binding protein 2